MMKAFVLLTLVACANAGAITSWTSGLRTGTSLATGAPMALAGGIEFKFTPATAVTAGTVVIEQTAPAAAIWAAETTGGAGVTTCACTSTGGDQTCGGSVDATKKILTVTLSAGKTLAAGALATITCSTNLADLGAAGTAVVFKAKTSADTVDKTGCTGYTPNNGKATYTSVVRSKTFGTSTAGNFVAKFTTQNSIAAGGKITLTSNQAIWAANSGAVSVAGTTGYTVCSATCGGTATNVTTSVVTGLQKVLTSTLSSGCAAATAVVLTCTTNIGANPAAGTAVTFDLATTGDIVATGAQTGYTTSGFDWTSGLRKGSSLAVGATTAIAGAIEFKFAPATAVPATGFVTITSNQAIWAAQTTGGAGATTCACTSTGGDQTCTAEVTDAAKKILKVTMSAGKTLAAGALATITCSDNLAALTAAGTAVTFDITSSADANGATGRTGYTPNNGKATWTSAVRSVTAVNSTAGNFVLSFTTQNSIAAGGKIKLTSNRAIWAADSGAVSVAGTTGYTVCTATCGGTATNVTTSVVTGTKTILTSTLSSGCAAASAVVLTCTSNLGANTYVVGTAVTFDLETTGDIVAVGAGQTGYTTTAAATPSTPTVSSASTATVISTLSFAAVALAAMLQ